jgi:S1-C subfamily serine protease
VDPEVRERCLAVLHELVNDEYLKEGEGFLGIRMQDEKALIPGEQAARSVLRVTQVLPDSAAQQAGLQPNDLIAGLDDKIWHDEAALVPFMNHVRQFKPGNRVTLRVLRNGKMIDLPVTLGRRPLLADNPFLDQRQGDIEAAERAAKEAYFRRWLERRKARD